MGEIIYRGGNPELEKEHAKYLITAGTGKIWGWDSPAGRERVNARVKWFIKKCGLRPGLNVLECGCGTGIFTRHFAQTGARITATDISGELIEIAKSQFLPQVIFVQVNLEDPEILPDNYFDVLCGVSVLHHLNLPHALLQLNKKLKPGACFAFTEPNLLNPINKYMLFTDNMEKRKRLGVTPTEMAFKPKELSVLFQESGFKVLSVEHRDFLHPSTPKSLIPLVKAAQFIAEKIPLIKFWSGSLWITGFKM
ncbi:MAG TPA: class I SAM-dependent methyltransferase [Deltaproteobacteria bacterium]|nr:class I SAM-dependent methyltransferase [Deltaproteobacteria bacterium]